ncbi:hypothetical protein [uncultured Gemella sp.]|uniref:hypothetical protein n=1 Tax=uncultured Gemella sp. TaxID=254352 RepID=UPI002607F9E2|nr:hypothetical protein [uncultured Gemella sp.]
MTKKEKIINNKKILKSETVLTDSKNYSSIKITPNSIELRVDDVEIETRSEENMETNYEKIIENIIRGLVNEACLNSDTYSEAKLYIDMNVSNTELGLMIKKIAHDKIENFAMNREING